MNCSLKRTGAGAPKASPVQGEVSAEQADGGVVTETECRSCIGFQRNRNILPHNPSVKIGSEEPILTAPFAQGSLCACGALYFKL